MSSILIADDEKSMREMLEIMLTDKGYRIFTASSSKEASEVLNNNDIDLLISDMKMPSDGGIGLLKNSLRLDKARPVIMITAYASAGSAVEAMKLGAFDYLTKPFKLDEIELVVRNALERRNLILENKNLKSELEKSRGKRDMIGKSREMNEIRAVVDRVADSSATVLITGESGTGKELIAQSLHTSSSRRAKPFLSINCGAMPEHLLESELFGHVKGAFTGASEDKKGLLKAANGGTFFFDEIAEMSTTLQVKLVRVIQEREIRQVGGINDIKLDVRFIAATNREIEEAVRDGSFREDLYYRLNVVSIKAPSLRQRREDIPLLAKHFLSRFNMENNSLIQGFTPEAMKLMEEYQWRGNIRELENVVERAVVLETDKWITPENLPDNLRYPVSSSDNIVIPQQGIDLEKKLSEIEKGIITTALKKSLGSRKVAAKLLNMNLRSLRYKIGKYDISL